MKGREKEKKSEKGKEKGQDKNSLCTAAPPLKKIGCTQSGQKIHKGQSQKRTNFGLCAYAKLKNCNFYT